MMSSTLVETVSINYEDFNESFLTCGTCLCMYDGGEHTPKLLPCSHTVCRQCLERIVASATQSRDTGTFRCPICRETITLPRGGVGALPPSFLVNQLLDLMSRQRRDVIPKCSTHTNQELLFCETCDCIFCSLCKGGFHGNGEGSSCEHTVIPFSIAIKRMSEILLYKAHQCIGKLNLASDNVSDEIRRLDQNVDRTFELINQSFQELQNLMEKRRQDLLGTVKKKWEEKKKALQEQQALVHGERSKVEEECEGLQYQVEVRNITKKISGLNTKLDEISTLLEPRENCFVKYDYDHNTALGDLQAALARFGRVRISKTFPALCTVSCNEHSTSNLRCQATVTTVDYHGNAQTCGGDPVTADLMGPTGETIASTVIDNSNGTYQVSFTPPQAGEYKMTVSIFGRPIKGSPSVIEVTEHNNPVARFGNKGTGTEQFLQPVRVTADRDGNLYVTDTGNGRIKVLTSELQFLRHLDNSPGLEERSAMGVAITPDLTLVVVNWRTKMVTEITLEGVLLRQFTHKDLQEPIDVAVGPKGTVYVADNLAGKVVVFDASGKFTKKFGSKGPKPGQFGLISAIAVGLDEEVLVADTRIQVFSKSGDFIRELSGGGGCKGQFGGLTVDKRGWVLATRSERSKSVVQVFGEQGSMLYVIDSEHAKLKRASGLCVLGDDSVAVVDLGNDCLKIYRYR